jgi:hypothetical protein
MTKKLLQLSLVVIIGLLVVAMPLYAATVTNALYVADVVAINTGTNTTNVATVVPIYTQALIDGKYVTSDLLNTALQTYEASDVPYMPGVGTNPWVFWISSISASQQKAYRLYSGGPAMQTSHYYFPASGGMTSADNNTSLELGSNFTIEQKGYVDTTAGSNKNLVYKQDAFRTYVSAAGSITSSILSSGSVSPYSSTSDGYIEATSTVYATAWDATTGTVVSTTTTFKVGQYFSSPNYKIERGFVYFDTSAIPDDATITSATLKLYGQTDSSATDFLITIQNGQPTYPRDPLVETDYNKTYYSGNGGSLTTVGFSTTGYNNITLNATGLTWINKTGTTKLCLRSDREIAGTTPTGLEYVAVYAADQTGTTYDPQLVVNYETSVTVTNVSSGERIVKTTANGTNMTLSVTNYAGTHQGNSPQSVALAGASVTNNDNTWSFITNGSMPYMQYHKIWIGGTLSQHIVYERNTTFNDLTEYNNDATPTFVTTSSDPDVTATFSNFRPINEARCTTGLTEETPQMLTETPEAPAEMYTEGSVNHLPGAELINKLLDAGDIPHDLFWIPFCFGLAALASVLGYYFLRSMFFIAIIGGVIILFFGLTGAIPLWTFLIYAVIAGGVLVSERTFGW